MKRIAWQDSLLDLRQKSKTNIDYFTDLSRKLKGDGAGRTVQRYQVLSTVGLPWTMRPTL